MDVNSLEGVKHHVVIAAIANTAPMTHNIPDLAIAAATRHPTAINMNSGLKENRKGKKTG